MQKQQNNSQNKNSVNIDNTEVKKDTKIFKLQTEESDNEDTKIDNFDFQKPTLIRDSRHVNAKEDLLKPKKATLHK